MKKLMSWSEIDLWCLRIERELDRSRSFRSDEREALVVAHGVLQGILVSEKLVGFPLLERLRLKPKTKKPKGKR
jgi:hypothetical protein